MQNQKEKTPNPRRERRAAYFDPPPISGNWGREGWGLIPRMDELTDEQWQLVMPLLPPENTIGRPAHEPRLVLNGILFYIRNALSWVNIPPEFPSYVTCFRRYHEWMEGGVLEQVIFTLTRHLASTTGLDFFDAWKTKKLSIHQHDGTLTIYLPEEYSLYWMQPTAALMMMWLYTNTMLIYQEAYTRTCKQLKFDRLRGQQGPRSVRPREVITMVGENPHLEKKKVEKPDLRRNQLDFIEKQAEVNPHRKLHPSPSPDRNGCHPEHNGRHPEHNGRHPERSEGSLS